MPLHLTEPFNDPFLLVSFARLPKVVKRLRGGSYRGVLRYSWPRRCREAGMAVTSVYACPTTYEVPGIYICIFFFQIDVTQTLLEFYSFRFCLSRWYMDCIYRTRPYKTRSTRYRSITHSLQRMMTLEAILDLTAAVFFLLILRISIERYDSMFFCKDDIILYFWHLGRLISFVGDSLIGLLLCLGRVIGAGLKLPVTVNIFPLTVSDFR